MLYRNPLTMWFIRPNPYRQLINDSEYADSENGDEKQLLHPEPLQTHDAVKTPRSRWLLVISLLMNVILIVAFISRHLHFPSLQTSGSWKGPWAGAAPKELAQPFAHTFKQAPGFGSTKQVVFEEDSKFMGDSPKVDAEWDNLWPREYRYLHVVLVFRRAVADFATNSWQRIRQGAWKRRRSRRLLCRFCVPSIPLHRKSHSIYAHTSFANEYGHQDVIRVFYNLVAGGKTITDFKHVHVPHCLEYLRQTVVCNADPTLEFTMDVSKEEDPRPGLHRYVDGQYVTHQCRDYEALVAWAEEHSYKNSSRILHDVDIE